MKIFALTDTDGTIVGVSEEKEAIKLFMHQNDLDAEDYSINKIVGEEGECIYNQFADTKGIVYVSRRDIVSIGRHADAIFEAMSSIRYEITNTINNLEYFSQLNLTAEQKSKLEGARRVLKKLTYDDIALEDAMREAIIFYLSKDSVSLLKDKAFIEGREY